MNQEDTTLLRELLQGSRVLALGVLVDGAPYIGLLPFALSGDRRALLVHASGLARHTRGMTDGAPFSALVHAPEADAQDPLQIPRLTLQGTIERLEPDSGAYEAGRARYEDRFPDSAQTFELPDFSLYALRITEGRLVAGFARARNVSPGDLSTL